jgi:formamidopyrimidine-DNA glycosylase
MPELPEVETLARTLRPALLGRTILETDLRWKRTLAAPSSETFRKKVRGQEIKDISRRAKFFDIQLSSLDLIIHLRMSGDLLVVLGGYEPAKHDRLILKLSGDATFVFSDPRKFGRVWLVNDATRFFSDLGPEPLSIHLRPPGCFRHYTTGGGNSNRCSSTRVSSPAWATSTPTRPCTWRNYIR